MTAYLSAEEALRPLRSGQHILLAAGASEPRHLVEALAARARALAGLETMHLLTLGPLPYDAPEFEGRIRHNALFIGPGVRGTVNRGMADYTPCFLSEIPGLIRSGRLPVDAALVSVTPPEGGVCSLGVSVDIVKAAVEAAGYVVAQINPRMPWTLGDSFLRAEDIDAFVLREEPLPELVPSEAKAASLWIGRYIALLVQDGDTIQAGIGSIPDAVLAQLAGKKDLGVHTELLSDGILSLWRKGVVTGRRKSLHPGKIVTSLCLGSADLYKALDRNPVFEFYPSDYVNSPAVIARNERMVAINSALEVDLTGQVCSDSIGSKFYSGVGGQVDFIRGAAASPGGRSIIALPSTAKAGTLSRIVSVLTPGAGVVTTRADVDFIVTEFGIASLKGKTIRERAVALISIAHPAHRRALREQAQALGYLDAGHVIPEEARPYRGDLEVRRSFGGRELFFRPLKPSDERRFKDLIYSQSPQTNYRRFGIPFKTLSEREFQELVAIDYLKSLSLGAFAQEGGRLKLVAVGGFCLNTDGRSAELGFTVHDAWQRLGIGTFLLDLLTRAALEEGLQAFTAGCLADNEPMLSVFHRAFEGVKVRHEPGWEVLEMPLARWKGAARLGAPGLVK